MNTIKLRAKMAYDSKRSVRYNECDEQGVELDYARSAVGSIYIKKDVLGAPYPDYITVEIRRED